MDTKYTEALPMVQAQQGVNDLLPSDYGIRPISSQELYFTALSVPSGKPVAAGADTAAVVQLLPPHHFRQGTLDGRLSPDQVAGLHFLQDLTGRQALVFLVQDVEDIVFAL